MTNDAQQSGTISRIVGDRGFGFIVCPANGLEYFLHYTDLVNCEISQLQVGDPVRFTPVTTAKGLRAEQITKHGKVERVYRSGTADDE